MNLISDRTKIKVDKELTTFGEFIADNSFAEEEEREIAAELWQEGSCFYGGGAAPMFTIMLAEAS